MSTVTKIGLVLAATAAVFSVACTAESDAAATAAGETPEVTLDSLDDQTEGSSYNGWQQSPYWWWQICVSNNVLGSQFIRNSGDLTRGGGAVLVHKTTTSCTSQSTNNSGDQFCTCGTTTCIDTQSTPTAGSARALYGADAYGYCYQSKCYHRPAHEDLTGVKNPNRTAGYHYMNPSTNYLTPPGQGDPTKDFALGCMTKTVGPNGACGGSNPSLYMRQVNPLIIDVIGCF